MMMTIARVNMFRPEPVAVETVILTIKSLNETRSVGCDGISLNFIRDSLYMIVFYLTVIVSTSLTTVVSRNLETCHGYSTIQKR